MKLNGLCLTRALITALFFYPLYTFSQVNKNEMVFFTQESETKNTIVRSLSNQSDFNSLNTLKRTSDYPTQIIRMSNSIESTSITCAQLNKEIDKIFLQKITRDKFLFTSIITCTYDPDSHFAVQFNINSYFDPLNDEAVEFLKTYLDEYNGTNFLGSTLTIEPAKALVVSLGLSAGIKKNPNNPPFIVYRSDRSNFYFKSNYEMRSKLVTDINENFLSSDPKKVLPFLDKWLFIHAGEVYKQVLRDSNYATLEPEQIFLMENGEQIFVSKIKYYFANNCDKYEHHVCLKRED